jgi:putative transposase
LHKLEQQTHTEEEHEKLGVDKRFQIPDELWESIGVLIPPPTPKKNKDRPGRLRMDDWKAMNAIFYVMLTGCHWKAIPRSLGAGSTVHDRFQEWRDAEVFQNMWKEYLLEYDSTKGINWGVASYAR